MTLPGFYAPSMAWLALLAGPLILFYFLKLRRPRQTISSLVLWQQVMQDRRVNSPFQRFKRNLLLLLQLLVLLFVVGAATQPYWLGGPALVKRRPILIDCSASMGALDRPGGVSRLDAAKQKVGQIIEGMLSNQEICLISFSRTAHKLAGFTSNKKELLDALSHLEVEDVPSDIEDALRMTQALARSSPFESVLLLSDGNFPARADFELSFKLEYQKLLPAGPNVGITSLAAARASDGTWDVLVQVEGSGQEDMTTAVELRADGNLVGAESAVVGQGRSQRMVFRVPGDKPSGLEVRLIPNGFSSLASDDVAYLELPVLRPLWVYVSPALASYRHALEALPGLRLFPDSNGDSPASGYDVVVTDRAEEAGSRQARTTLVVSGIPPGLEGLVAVQQDGTQVVDWRRNSPLLLHVELSDLVILDDPQYLGQTREGDLEKLGYEVLVHGRRGPLVLQKRDGDRVVYHLLFHTDRSTLPYRVGFPILVSNLVHQAMYEAGLTEVQAAHTGVLPAIDLSPDRTYRVEDPSGGRRDQSSDRGGRLAGTPAPRVGLYRVYDGGTLSRQVGASLLSAQETALAGADTIQFNEDLSVAASEQRIKADRSLWRLLALVGFSVLLFEWLYYNRSTGWFLRLSTKER